MIGISKLYCGTIEPSDPLRYERDSSKLPAHLLQFAADKKPVVVWNITKSCNLQCRHCYAQSENRDYSGELNTAEGKKLIKDLANFGSPVVLFSGGEPLLRGDLLELARVANDLGMRTVISSNGTLITKKLAKEMKKIGLSYIGISLDGLAETHDRFRGVKGAFTAALRGLRYCQDAGLKVGLRFTINRRNFQDIPGIFAFLAEEKIPRICFYHLVYVGRGSELIREDLTHQETREVVDLIINLTQELHEKGQAVEVLTVDNHADGPYLYLRLLKEGSPRAPEVLELLRMNGGNNSGVGIGCVSWEGSVHADQFWRHYSFGNVRQRPFSEIWTDTSDPLMAKLKEKKKYVQGRCASCRWLDLCAGNLRVRAEAVTGNIWAADPACYLTDEEIGVKAGNA